MRLSPASKRETQTKTPVKYLIKIIKIKAMKKRDKVVKAYAFLAYFISLYGSTILPSPRSPVRVV